MADVVEVRLYAAARTAVGASTLQVPAGPLSSVLATIEAEHPPFVPVRWRCSFLIDGEAVHDQSVVVAPGSVVDVLPPFAGG